MIESVACEICFDKPYLIMQAICLALNWRDSAIVQSFGWLLLQMAGYRWKSLSGPLSYAPFLAFTVTATKFCVVGIWGAVRYRSHEETGCCLWVTQKSRCFWQRPQAMYLQFLQFLKVSNHTRFGILELGLLMLDRMSSTDVHLKGCVRTSWIQSCSVEIQRNSS